MRSTRPTSCPRLSTLAPILISSITRLLCVEPELLLLLPEAIVKPGATERQRDRETERFVSSLRLSVHLSLCSSVPPSPHLSVAPSLCPSVPPSLHLLRWRARRRCGQARAFANSPHAPTSR